jgi:hypothetical protein
MIRWDHLAAITAAKRAEWHEPNPIRYITIDGMMEPGICEALADFSRIAPKLERPLAKSHKHVRGKTGTPSRDNMTELQRRFFDEVNGERFLRFVEQVTGIAPVYADPNLHGGGLHQIRRGGYLNVHTDFNFDPDTRRNRRLNLLLYLNQEWDPAWRGAIELWTPALDRPFFSALPLANRVLLFETSETSYHGHPVPLATPPEITRKSLAVYYYSDWPADVSLRKETGYQLTRRQWADLIGRIADLVSARDVAEDEAVAALEIDYQTADVRRAYRTLMDLRSAKMVKEEYWELPDGTLSLTRP